ncbi:hypothetical protein [Nonomuraea dietziae]|uniref:Uncharacterized protein n=1 Tax=Nonomuraea dietziae TaxID=65515 RepID=A0A7W5V5T2_9ACTN|nr:hypothetical protein [Nonomuraea dietziae]MBB3728426.1 hypothetical protein [Nonomuraea dietziae]
MDMWMAMYVEGIASSTFAAYLAPSNAAFAIPLAMGAQTCSPDAQDTLANAWEESVGHMRTALTGLEKVDKNAQMPKEWSADDQKEFLKNAKDLIADVNTDIRIKECARDVCRACSTVSKGGAVLSATAGTTMLIAAYAAAVAAAAPMIGTLASRIGMLAVSNGVLRVVSGALSKKMVMIGTAGAVLALGEGWLLTQQAQLNSKVTNPEGGKPDFKQAESGWEKKLNEKQTVKA